MKPPTAEHLYSILRILDWQGHVELGDSDLWWMAQELSVALEPSGEVELCEVCECIKPIVVKSPLGRICEDCLDSLADEAAESRELAEEDE